MIVQIRHANILNILLRKWLKREQNSFDDKQKCKFRWTNMSVTSSISLFLSLCCVTADALMIREKWESVLLGWSQRSAAERERKREQRERSKESTRPKENEGGKDNQSLGWHQWVGVQIVHCSWHVFANLCPMSGLGNQRCRQWPGGKGQERAQRNVTENYVN